MDEEKIYFESLAEVEAHVSQIGEPEFDMQIRLGKIFRGRQTMAFVDLWRERRSSAEWDVKESAARAEADAARMEAKRDRDAAEALRLRELEALEASTDAAKMSARAALFAAVVSFFALVVAVAAFMKGR
jgi:hypothetical protein